MTSDGDLNIAGQITRDAVEKTSELIVVALREVVPQHGAIGVKGAGTVELRARDRHGNAGWIKIVLIGDGLETGHFPGRNCRTSDCGKCCSIGAYCETVNAVMMIGKYRDRSATIGIQKIDRLAHCHR